MNAATSVGYIRNGHRVASTVAGRHGQYHPPQPILIQVGQQRGQLVARGWAANSVFGPPDKLSCLAVVEVISVNGCDVGNPSHVAIETGAIERPRAVDRQRFAAAQVIYLPEKFVSTHPHWVVNNLDWVVTRYLMIGESRYLLR